MKQFLFCLVTINVLYLKLFAPLVSKNKHERADTSYMIFSASCARHSQCRKKISIFILHTVQTNESILFTYKNVNKQSAAD